MGHSTITITLDRYGHLLPGNEHEAATLLDNWLQHQTEPLRESCRLQPLRGWSHVKQIEEVLAGGS
jgi:hypothetical protein